MDTNNGAPIEYASVTLHSATDSSMINGVVTDQDGHFQITKVRTGKVYLTAQFLGYETYRSDPFLLENDLDLGTIKLGVNSSVLQEVEVTGRAITNLQKLDKQVFDAGQFQSAQGGKASDVLRNLPSISVNALGEIVNAAGEVPQPVLA